MKKTILLLFIIMISFYGTLLWAGDFGLLLDQNLALSGAGSETDISYTGILIPRFSILIGENGGLYVSAGANIQNDPWIVIPELLRTDFYWRFAASEIRLGRMLYADPLGYIANGLFDGAQYSIDTNIGTFSAGGWYTGLLYKKRANITMTPEEYKSNEDPFKYSEFLDTYFAPKRIMASLSWEHPSISDLFSLNFSILGQVDLSSSNLHSQYAILKAALPYNSFVFDLGGSFGLIENDGDLGIGLSGDIGVAWLLPTKIEDRLSLLGRFTSGVTENGKVKLFLPITTVLQGYVLKEKLSGLSLISLGYLGRFHRTFSAGLYSTYFLLSDSGIYTASENNGHFYGNEFFAHLIWSPVSDIQANLGAGVFLPSMGNVAPDADAFWRIELSLTISLY